MKDVMDRDYYMRRIAIVAAMRAVAKQFAHYKAFPKKKFADALRAEFLRRALPEYVVYVGSPSYSPTTVEIAVWGSGISHGNQLRLSLHGMRDNMPTTWQSGLEAELDRADLTDKLEHVDSEETLVPELEAIEEQIAALRAKARAMWVRLPIPKSATIRRDACFWDRPSYEIRERFPLALGED